MWRTVLWFLVAFTTPTLTYLGDQPISAGSVCSPPTELHHESIVVAVPFLSFVLFFFYFCIEVLILRHFYSLRLVSISSSFLLGTGVCAQSSRELCWLAYKGFSVINESGISGSILDTVTIMTV